MTRKVNTLHDTVNHDELSELLPWYVNETLDRSERTRVELHLEQCAECRDSVELLLDVRRAVRSGSPAPLVPQPAAERLLAALDRRDRGASRRAWPWVALAATVAAVAIAVTWQVVPRPANSPVLYETLTSTVPDRSINYVLEVRFEHDAPAETRLAFFESLGASEVATRVENLVYRVALGLGPVSLSQLEEYAENIESRPEIAAARFVAVQLPVE